LPRPLAFNLSSPPPPPGFSFNPTATTPIYTLSLHDALPISRLVSGNLPISSADIASTTPPASRLTSMDRCRLPRIPVTRTSSTEDRKSTRLNSSHVKISYAVFCWKKENPADPKHDGIAHVPS